MPNLNEINEGLKRAFIKIRREMGQMKTDLRTQSEDIAMIRQNLLEFNVFKKKIENIEKNIGKISVETPVEEEEEKRGFFSKLFFWRQ